MKALLIAIAIMAATYFYLGSELQGMVKQSVDAKHAQIMKMGG
jgi:pentose-5-phosphate-3-epimerase